MTKTTGMTYILELSRIINRVIVNKKAINMRHSEFEVLKLIRNTCGDTAVVSGSEYMKQVAYMVGLQNQILELTKV